MTLFAVIPVAAIAVGAVSTTLGLIGSKKAPTASPAQQITNLFTAGLPANTLRNSKLATRADQQVIVPAPARPEALAAGLRRADLRLHAQSRSALPERLPSQPGGPDPRRLGVGGAPERPGMGVGAPGARPTRHGPSGLRRPPWRGSRQ